MNKIYGTIFLSLIVVFMLYNFDLYTNKTNYGVIKLSPKAIKGETLWLKNNCNSCHQLYGLGGYLGPDLTNITSQKSDEIIKIFMNSGVKSMPLFSFSSQEQEALLQFLKEIDKTGYYPNKNAKTYKTGWV